MNEPKPNEAETGAAVGCSAWLGDGLRPCPLCGGKPKITGASVLGGLLNNLGMECQTCGMETRDGQFEKEDDLIEFWNRRIGDESPNDPSSPTRPGEASP
jgi:Lar family restriction alleviation protein